MGKLDPETQDALADLIRLSHELAGIEARIGRKTPTVINLNWRDEALRGSHHRLFKAF